MKLKHQSKRQTLKQKYSIEKKVKSHNRRMRKVAKDIKRRRRADPGIPNTWPFKDELLAEIKEERDKREAERLRKRAEARAQRKALLAQQEDAPIPEEQETEEVAAEKV